MNLFGIIMVLAMAGLAVVPVAKTPPPSLHSQAFSQTIPMTPIASLCGSPGLNFTISVNGHDPGSTFVSWNFLSNGPSSGIELYLFGPNSTTTTICGSAPWNNALSVITTQTMFVRILSSGFYTIMGPTNAGPSGPIVETWTVTAIS